MRGGVMWCSRYKCSLYVYSVFIETGAVWGRVV